MRSKLLKISCFIAAVIIFAYPAFATVYNAPSPEYIYTSTPNSSVSETEILWGVQNTHDATITTATVKYLVQTGDQVSVNWYDSSGSFVSSTSLTMSGSPETLTPPSNAYGARLVLTTGSASGGRWAWWSSVSNSQGNTTVFPDPNTSSGGTTTIDLTPVVSALETIQGQLTTIQGQLNTLLNNSSSSSGQLSDQLGTIVTAINNQTSAIGGKLDDIKSKLNDIGGQLSTIQGQLNTIDSHVVDIYSYISTPRTPQPLVVNMPSMTVDPTPPPITEPPQQPYKYDRNPPQMPPFIDSPGPWPLSPDPKVMEHDIPRQITPPVAIQQPRVRDPVMMDAPIQRDPVRTEPPRTQDPVIRQAPRTTTPVNKEAPRQIDQPRTRDNPIQPAQPIQPAPPLVPDPPLAPQPPL